MIINDNNEYSGGGLMPITTILLLSMKQPAGDRKTIYIYTTRLYSISGYDGRGNSRI